MNCFRVWVVPLCWSLLLGLAQAKDVIKIQQPELRQQESGWVLQAQAEIPITPALEEAIQSGIVITYRTELEITKPRWYWYDSEILSAQRDLALSYHSLTRQYRVSRGSLYQHFPSLSQALRHAGSLRNWVIAEKDLLKPGSVYQTRLRMRVDITQLPKPFQVMTQVTRELAQSSEWTAVSVHWGTSGE